MINPFDSLDAQSAESHLAQVRANEMLDLEHEQNEMELLEASNPLDADKLGVQWIADEASLYSIGIN